MPWSADIQVASFRGVSFEVINVSDTFERRIAEHEFPYKDGAQLEDVGRRARPVSIETIFHGSDYLAELIAFLGVANEGATGTLIHPILGALEAKVVSVEVEHDQSRRDSASVRLEFKEDGVNTQVPSLLSIQSAADDLNAQSAQTRDDSDDLSALAAADGDAATIMPDTVRALDDADAFADSLDETDQALDQRLGQLRKNIDDAISEVDALVTTTSDVVDDVTKTVTRDGLRRVLFLADRLKERTERLQPTIISKDLNLHVPMVTLALSLYDDPDRADDLLRLNSIRDPFLIPPGTTLKVFSS